MKSKFLKKCLCVIISAILVLACMPSAFAVLSQKPDNISATSEGVKYHPGRVLVSVAYGAPSFAEMLEGFEITNTRLLTPGSANQIVYLVEFSEKTYEIVWEAIEVLSENPYIIAAEPDYIGEWCVEPVTTVPATEPEDPTTPASTIPIIVDPTEPDTTPVTSEGVKYHPGRVLVSVTYGAPSFAEMLEGFEITNTRLLTPGSANQIVYLVEFSEKTYEIVWEAIEVLSENSYVIVAEPDYIGEWCVEPVTTVPATELEGVTEATASVPMVPAPTMPVVVKPTAPAISETEDNNDNDLSLPDESETVGEYLPVVTFVKGDANGDGELTVKDATCIQKYLAGLVLAETQGEYSTCSVTADYDGDGQVTIKDATTIQKKIAEII